MKTWNTRERSSPHFWIDTYASRARTYDHLCEMSTFTKGQQKHAEEIMRRTLLQILVDYENLARTINLLTEVGVSDFYCVEYWRASAQDWPGFLIKEDPEMIVQAIKDNAERAVQVSTVVNGDRIDSITQAVTAGLAGKVATIMTLPIDSVTVVSP